MNVITLASRKGGSGKSTLTAHLAAFAQKLGRRCLILDADPQGSLTLWHSMRGDRQPPLENAARGIDRLLAHAMIDGVEWVFIDTAPTLWVVVQEAIRAAAGLFRSRRRRRDGQDRARTQQALRGGDQCRAGQARREGSAGGRGLALSSRRWAFR